MIITHGKHGDKDNSGDSQYDKPLSGQHLYGPGHSSAHKVPEVEEQEAGNGGEVSGGEGAVS